MAQIKSPQLQIYNTVYKLCEDLGYDTYDYLPPSEVSYPFIFIGEQFSQDEANKTAIHGSVQQTIHIYHTHENRKEVSEMIFNVQEDIRKLKNTDNYYVAIKGITNQMITDVSTDSVLIHGIVEIDFSFN